MVERNNNKSVSNILGIGFKSSKYSPNATERGNYLHSLRRRFYEGVLKKGYRSKINYITLSQRISEIRQNLLEETIISPKYKKYKKEVRQLIKALSNEILNAAKLIAKSHNGRVTPEEIEEKLFDGVISFEESETGEIAGVEINARIDDIIYLSSGNVKIREFKSNLLLDEEDPSDPASSYNRDWMQAALYAKIIEEVRNITCESFELIYYPNNSTTRYVFTDEVRSIVLEFIKENGIDALDFTLMGEIEEEEEEEKIEISEKKDQELKTIQESETTKEQNTNAFYFKPESEDHLGRLDTTKDKPFKLVRNRENRMDGILFPKRAGQVMAGSYVAVEKIDGIRIICMVEEIDSYNGNVTGVTKSLKEQVFKIKLNPICELLPSGPQYPKPQTIAQGKIMKLKENEFYLVKNLSLHGIPLGDIEDGNQEKRPYYLSPHLLFQSVFVGGVQGTGKTNCLKIFSFLTAQMQNPPAQVIFDAEEEYINLDKIPTTSECAETMRKRKIRPINLNKYELIQIDENSRYCLTLKGIDPLHLPIFLHELQPISFSQLQRIIQDIKNDNRGRDFTFPELRCEIFTYIQNSRYRLNQSIRDAIYRALQSISLDLFDTPNKTPINVDGMLNPGRVTVINVFNLRDDQQRIVALYLLALFHKQNMKRGKNSKITYSGVLFLLDEVQRILPQNLSNTAYQRRIVQFLEEIHHRGRKRDYGIIYATQSPADIKKMIVDLCNTKVFFQIQGSTDFLKQYFPSKDMLEQLKKLPTGVAYITCKGKHEPVIIKFPYLS